MTSASLFGAYDLKSTFGQKKREVFTLLPNITLPASINSGSTVTFVYLFTYVSKLFLIILKLPKNTKYFL